MGDLGRRLARGDPAAFAEMYDTCATRCHHYLTVHLGSRDAADEVLQEAFLRLVRSRHQLAAVDNLLAYLLVVVRHEAARYLARRGREAERRTPLTGTDLFEVASDREGKARETADAVAAALSRLGSEQREVVELKIYGGLTFREIAEITGVALPTAASRYQAALKRLREWLEGDLS
jgi:RNA polymerase sigma-70 factor, ECF subfamily